MGCPAYGHKGGGIKHSDKKAKNPAKGIAKQAKG
jgi:hypothetical protein